MQRKAQEKKTFHFFFLENKEHKQTYCVNGTLSLTYFESLILSKKL